MNQHSRAYLIEVMNLHAKFTCSHSCCQGILAVVSVICVYRVVHIHQTFSNADNMSDTQRMQHRSIACMFAEKKKKKTRHTVSNSISFDL